MWKKKWVFEAFKLQYFGLSVVFDEYEESSTQESSDDHQEKAPMLSKALAGMGDPDAEETQKPIKEDGTLQAGRYGAPQSLAPLGVADSDDEDSEDKYDSQSSKGESVTATGKPSTSLVTLESHSGMYSERDPILKDATKKPGSVVGTEGYVGTIGNRATPQAGVKVRHINQDTQCITENLSKFRMLACVLVLPGESNDKAVEAAVEYTRLVVKTFCFLE